MSNTIKKLETDVYDAINMYQNNGRHKLLKTYYEEAYKKYCNAGGKRSLEYFEKTIDEYNIQGVCGY